MRQGTVLVVIAVMRDRCRFGDIVMTACVQMYENYRPKSQEDLIVAAHQETIAGRIEGRERDEAMGRRLDAALQVRMRQCSWIHARLIKKLLACCPLPPVNND